MKNVLIRLLLAAAAMCIGLGLTSSAQTQQGDEDRSTAARQEPSKPPSAQEQQGAQMPSHDAQTQDAHSFTGRVVKENGQLVLKDPVTKLTYGFDDQEKVKQYTGKQVKVTGSLDSSSKIIHIESIEPMP